MGNAASSGCFPSKKRAAAEAAAAEAEEPAAEELSDLEEEEVQLEQAAPSTAIESSPAPPLVMVDIKEKNQLSASSQVKNEWYEFGVDEKVCGECPPPRQIRNTKKRVVVGLDAKKERPDDSPRARPRVDAASPPEEGGDGALHSELRLPPD